MSELMLLTDKAIAKLPFAQDGQYKVRDADLKGFFVRIGKRSKTYMVQGEHWRDGFREFAAQKKLGEFGSVSARGARVKAKEALVGFTRGERPGLPMRVAHGAITVRGAWERYRDAHYRLLKAHDLITSPAYVVIKAADQFHTKTTRPNEMSQTDFTYFKIIG